VTNLLSCDTAIAEADLARHAYDVISFNFKAAFDKAPHSFVIEALAEKGVYCTALSWFASLLTGRTQQVMVGDCLSDVCNVTSGMVQGSASGPGLYTVLADSLLRRIELLCQVFADDFKFVADVTMHSQAVVQADVNAVVQ
jgi:hypothetical protein